MKVPQRVQASRHHKEPANCRRVCRPSKYGNDYEIVYVNKKTNTFCVQNKKTGYVSRMIGGEMEAHEHAVEMFQIQTEALLSKDPAYYDDLLNYNFISCFCPLSLPCHCDAIIKHLKQRIKILTSQKG